MACVSDLLERDDFLLKLILFEYFTKTQIDNKYFVWKSKSLQ